MKNLRRLHLLLGCFFAPMLLYYCASGAWQTLGWNITVRPSDGEPAHPALRQASEPHMRQTFPGGNPKRDASPGFRKLAVAMCAGIFLTTLLGLVLAIRSFRPRWAVATVVAAGVAIPALLLWSALKS